MVKINKSEVPGKITCDADYRKDPVFKKIKEDCYEKCYLCEFHSTSYRVEHIVPRDKKPELAHEWDNLLLACPHCNEIKGDKYDNILDCTKVDPEDVINFKYIPYPMSKPEFTLKEVDESLALQGKQTVELLNEIFLLPYTDQKFYEAEALCDKLYEAIEKFKERVQNYREAREEDKKECYTYVSMSIRRSYPFAAFTRAVARERYFDMFGAALEE